jgi:hypothetical protein
MDVPNSRWMLAANMNIKTKSIAMLLKTFAVAFIQKLPLL